MVVRNDVVSFSILWYNIVMPTYASASSRQSSLLFRWVRIYPHEFGRAATVWCVRFMYRFGLVLTWTLLVALVVTRFGDQSLPLLFLLNAAIVVLGSVGLFALLKRVSLDLLFIGSIFAGSVGLLLLQLFHATPAMIFVVLLLVHSIIFTQLSVHIETFTERAFTPGESSRTFPFVESGDTIAALAAGSFMYFLAPVLFTERVVWIIVAVLALMIPVFLQYHSYIRSLPAPLGDASHEAASHSATSFSVRDVLRDPFARRLSPIVFFQWVFAVILEFLMVYLVSHAPASGIVNATSSGLDNALVHEFGALYIFFGLAALASQMLFAGRFISSIGLVGSMLLHPIVGFLSLAGMLTRFTYFTGVLARVNAEITGVLYRNAYQASYYVFDDERSQFVRTALDGIVRPLASLAGSFLLVIAFRFAPTSYQILGVFAIVLVALSGLTWCIAHLQRFYTQYALTHLSDPAVDVVHKITLLDVLGQKGHAHLHDQLHLLCDREEESAVVRAHALMQAVSSPDDIPVVLNYLHHPSFYLRSAAVALLHRFLSHHFFEQHGLSRTVSFQTLSERYTAESSSYLRRHLVSLMIAIDPTEASLFLARGLTDGSGEMVAEMLSLVPEAGDPSLLSFAAAHLSSKDPRVWAQAVAVLSLSEHYQSEIRSVIHLALHDHSIATCRALAFCSLSFHDEALDHYLAQRRKASKDSIELFYLLLGELIAGDTSHMTQLFELLSQMPLRDITALIPTFRLITHMSVRLLFERELHAFLSRELFLLYRRHPSTAHRAFSLDELHALRAFFTLLSSPREVATIDAVLLSRGTRIDVADSPLLTGLPLPPLLYITSL